MIRRGRDEDAAAVRAIAHAAYARFVPLIGREPAPMVADFEAALAAAEVWVWADDAVLGFILCRVNGDSVHVENVAVSPLAQGKGIGSTLLSHAESLAVHAGLSKLDLYTNVVMTDALALYPRLGFVEVDRREEACFQRVYFEKRLA